jgi:hypothetical protein
VPGYFVHKTKGRSALALIFFLDGCFMIPAIKVGMLAAKRRKLCREFRLCA